jgi:hypothetical protein
MKEKHLTKIIIHGIIEAKEVEGMNDEIALKKFVEKIKQKKIKDLGWDAAIMEVLGEEDKWREVYDLIPEKDKAKLKEEWEILKREYPVLQRFVVLDYLESLLEKI